MRLAGFRTALTLSTSIFTIGQAFAGGEEYFNLSSARKMQGHWDYYTQIEHKGAVEYTTSSVCLAKQDLLDSFPKRDGTGMYWDYLSMFQKGRSTMQFDLGYIGATKIIEIVHHFKEPVDYVKILSFTPPKSDLLCPFAIIADWNGQLQYSKSEVIEQGGLKLIKTAMTDKIAFGSKPEQPIPFYFKLEDGFPKKHVPGVKPEL